MQYLLSLAERPLWAMSRSMAKMLLQLEAIGYDCRWVAHSGRIASKASVLC